MRIKELDYLRGLAALSILCFHHYSWLIGEPNSSSFIGKIGLYGVSIFYVLSGLTLYLLYHNRLSNFREIKSFFIKRIFRIYPLLIFVSLIYILYSSGQKKSYIIFLNITGLFGFIAPEKYLATGAWSIGNELVFYIFFPVFIFLINYNFRYFVFAFMITLLCGLYFAFSYIDTLSSLKAEWAKYVNPLNQMFLFSSGILIGYLGRIGLDQRVLLGLLVSTIGLFTIIQIEEGSIHLITGLNRIVLSLITIFVCYLFYSFHQEVPKYIDKSLSFLGEVSYSLYMIHPLTFTVLSKTEVFKSNKFIFFITSLIGSIVISHLIYIFLEKPFINIGKRIMSKTEKL